MMYWDLSVYIAPIALGVVAISLGIFAWRLVQKGKRLRDFEVTGRPSYTSDEMFMLNKPGSYRNGALASVVGIVAFAGILLGAHYPLEAAYHQWRSVSGPVEQIESRFTGTSSGTSEEYVAVVNGVERHLTDSRASLLSTGDQVDLMCKQVWQYGAASINVCRWGGTTVNR